MVHKHQVRANIGLYL